MKCIVGLGNPGKKYHLTRHNVGFRVLDGLQARHRTETLKSGKSYSLVECSCGPERVHLMRPLTYMNCSGHGLMDYLQDRGTAVSDLLVVTDDVYLPLGRIRIRRSGGDGGHNGMASLVEFLGTELFPRLRIGVGAPRDSGELATYVLRVFSQEEVPVVDESVARACDAVETFVLDGIDAAMNRFNG